MKKLSLVFGLVLLLSGGIFAHAQTATDNCNSGDPQYACSTDEICKGSPIPTCQKNGAVQSSGTCTVDAGCVNYGAGYTCKGGTCVAPASGSSSAPGSTGAPANTSSGFVPLAPIPGLTQGVVANSSGLAQFLNNLYKFLIGIAAVLAVIEIIRGGLYIMTESVTKHSEGKKLIYDALLGLALVLAPVLVFTIINPSILNLSLNLPPIKQAASGSSLGSSGTPNTPAPGQIGAGQEITNCTDGSSCLAAREACIAKGGSASTQCVDPQGQLHEPSLAQNLLSTFSFGYVGNGTACANSDQSLATICSGARGSAGLSNNSIASGGVPLFDGGYMDLVKFTGKSAQTSASSYKCQVSQQTFEKAFSNTDQSAWYVECLTPKITYVEAINNYVDDANRTIRDRYDGECQAITSTQGSEGFGGVNLLQDQGIGGSAPTVQCTKDQIDNNSIGGITPTCYQAYSTCTDPNAK